jgi:hypothetical protein
VSEARSNTTSGLEIRLKNEILEALKTFGWQPTSAMTFAFGSDFGPAIKALHKEGKVEKHKNGWKAA